MRPQPCNSHDQLELFQAHFDQILNLQHPLCRLANKIDWNRFDAAFADCYSPDMGAPAKATRLLVGLHYLKHTFNESDESLIERWVEKPVLAILLRLHHNAARSATPSHITHQIEKPGSAQSV